MKTSLFTLLILASLALSACAKKGADAAQSSHRTRVAIFLAPSGKGDRSYNDMALKGVSESPDAETIELSEIQPPRVDDYEATLTRVLDDPVDLVVCVGYTYAEAVASVSLKHPKVSFLLIDGEVKERSNVRSIGFKPQEGSFLVGVAAGMRSNSGQVGFIAGMDIPIMQTFACGFREGVAYAADIRATKIRVVERFIGSTPDAFSNPAQGRDIAKLLYASGVDIIYHAAGASGNGVIQAAKEQGALVIGVDTDQSYLAPRNVLTSMRKRIDRAVADAIAAHRSSSFNGGTVMMNLSNGGVDYVKSDLAEESTWNVVEEAKQKILSGQLQPCAGKNEN